MEKLTECKTKTPRAWHGNLYALATLLMQRLFYGVYQPNSSRGSAVPRALMNGAWRSPFKLIVALYPPSWARGSTLEEKTAAVHP